MGLFGKKTTTIYTAASIDNNFVTLNTKTRGNMSHNETLIRIDKISSISHSVIFGPKSRALMLWAGILILLGVVLMIFKIFYGAIAVVLGFLLVILAVALRDHSIIIDCSGDVHEVCIGRKQTDEYYAHLVAALRAKTANPVPVRAVQAVQANNVAVKTAQPVQDKKETA